MIREKEFAVTGYCPTLKKEHTIYINYLDVSSMLDWESLKEKFTCSQTCEHADTCPIYKNAPNEVDPF